jgi:hypothetical protein
MPVDIMVDFERIARDIQKETKEALKKQQKKLLRELKKATSAWKTPAQFDTEKADEGVTIVTNDDRVTWVDEGTKPHTITPKRHRFLKFRPGDNVRQQIARRQTAQASQDVAVFAKSVQHPGIKPRNFVERVMKKQEGDIVAALEDAIEKVIR